MDIEGNKPFECSYFALLPNELLIEILKYVNTEELVNFCDAYNDCEYFFQEKTLISKINITQYCNVKINSIRSRIDHSIVTCLNLNGCHWIPAKILRSFIWKLENLKELQALRTKLCFSDDDIRSYSKTKIDKIALTLTCNFSELEKVKTLATITTLGLDIRNVSDFRIDKLRFPNLKKLWIETSFFHPYSKVCSWIMSQHSENLKNLIISSAETVTSLHVPLTNYYVGRKTCQPQIACFELLKNPKEKIEFPSSWQVLADTHSEMPFGPKDAKLLYTGKETLETILFQELNFQHKFVCSERQREAYKEILNSTNSYGVKKLAIPTCILDTSTEQNECENINKGFKRRRTGIDCNKRSNDSVLSNFKEIRHFEMYSCPHAKSFDGYNSISKFAQLRYLYVQIPTTNNGKFLLDVSQNCSFLETLWIHSLNVNEIINYHVHKALEYSTNLKEFTFTNDRLRIDDLISFFNNSTGIKLRKLWLTCSSTDKFNPNLLAKYLNDNPQLMYCLINIRDLTQKQQNQVKQIVNSSKMPHRVFVICNDTHQQPHIRDIIKEMREFESSTCYISLKEEFGSF